MSAVLNKIKLTKYNSLQFYQFLRFGSFFLISILLAKIAYYRFLPEYGTLIISRYEGLLLISGSVTWFWVSSICNTLIPYYNASNTETQKRILFNAFVLLTAFSLLAGIVTYLVGYARGVDVDLYQMFAVVVFFNTPSYLTDYIFYLKGKFKSLLIWGAVTFALQIILLCVPLFMRNTLNLAINLWLVLSMLKFNYTIVLLMKYASVTVHTRLILDFMKKVTPFMFSIFLAGSMEYINSFLVQYKFSDEEFAIYRYASKELPIFLILANSLSNIYSGEIANLNKEGNFELGLEKLKNANRRLMRWLFPGTILFMAFSKYFFMYAYNANLVEGYKIFNVYLLLIISRMLFPQTVIMGMMKNRIFYLVSSNYLIINVTLAIWFLNIWGTIGTAYATVIAYLVEKIMLVIYCKTQGIDIKKYTPLGEYIVFSLITIAAYFVITYVDITDIIGLL
jgi:O-antigen/teichoic acid export membrane protein